MKVAVTGGGTGGHTLPVLAVIKSLKEIDPDIKIFFIGSRFGMESQLIPKIGVKYYGISTGKFRRYHKSKILNFIDPTTIYKNVTDFFKFLNGIKESRQILKYEKPDVIFAKGGFVSLPVGYASRFLKIPLVIHESDTVMGMSNRMMSKYAIKVAVTFPTKMYSGIAQDKIVETGSPVRDDLAKGDKARYFSEIGFDLTKKTLLVIGGSQGSLFINESVAAIATDILSKYQLLWIAGERDADLINYRLQDLPKQMQSSVKIYGFVSSELADIYDAADLVICRPGSNVLFELAALSKPAILIPPSSEIAGGHQFENARYFSRNGGTLVIKQTELTSKKLFSHIVRLLDNGTELSYMGEKIHQLASTEAAKSIAELIYSTGENSIEQTRKDSKE